MEVDAGFVVVEFACAFVLVVVLAAGAVEVEVVSQPASKAANTNEIPATK